MGEVYVERGCGYWRKYMTKYVYTFDNEALTDFANQAKGYIADALEKRGKISKEAALELRKCAIIVSPPSCLGKWIKNLFSADKQDKISFFLVENPND